MRMIAVGALLLALPCGSLMGQQASDTGSGREKGVDSDRNSRGIDSVDGGVFGIGGGVSAPTLRHKVEPEYSEEAREAKLQGTVLLAIEVWEDGKAHNIRVLRSLGLGLDEKAMEAVQLWNFVPGEKDGVPVRTRANVEVNFRLFCGSGANTHPCAANEQLGEFESGRLKQREQPAEGSVKIPRGTNVPLALINSISTKHATPGDRVYLKSVYPVVVDGRIVIPPGTYVSGSVTTARRPGRIKGRGDLFLRFEQIILPNGVIRDLIGRVGALDGRSPEDFDREEGNITSEGNKGGDAGTVGQTTATGASIGAIAGASAGKAGLGVGLGAAAGAAAGLAGVFLSRGPEVVLGAGTELDMVLQRDLFFTEHELTFHGPLHQAGVGNGRTPNVESPVKSDRRPARSPEPKGEDQSQSPHSQMTTEIDPTSSPREDATDVEFFGSKSAISASRFRLRTENFGVMSDLTNNDQLGQILLALERARALFLYLYGKVPEGIVTVVVKGDLAEIQKTCRTLHGVGCYINRGRLHSILLSSTALANGAAAPAVHEYTHLIEHEMGYDRAPAWIHEGIAEYYENIEFKKGKLYVGYFNPRRVLPSWLHIDSILTMGYAALGQDASLDDNQAFYAQSHLLIHMLRHTPQYNAQLAEFLRATKNGMDSREAFRKFYGVSTDDLHNELTEYYRKAKFQKVEVFEGINVPNIVFVGDGSGRKVKVKEKKCRWCTAGKIIRHVPIFVPIP